MLCASRRAQLLQVFFCQPACLLGISGPSPDLVISRLKETLHQILPGLQLRIDAVQKLQAALLRLWVEMPTLEEGTIVSLDSGAGRQAQAEHGGEYIPAEHDSKRQVGKN